MSEAVTNQESQEKGYPALVASVLNNRRIAINRGALDGIQDEQRFLLYEVSDQEIKDPVTGESLGKLEIPKGTGIVVNVQDRMAVIESDTFRETSKLMKRGAFVAPLGEEEHVTLSNEPAPFQNPKVGDLVKPI
jgi:hypothetical protein